jgi:EF-hand domain-containing protein 1
LLALQLNQADEGRLFVLSYFMNDDTISVFEPPLRNSGMVGGKFLERGIKYKPGTEEQYTYKDLYVGAEIVINSFNFMLTNADEYTFSYMENNKHLFIMGDGQAVLQLLQAQVAVRTHVSSLLAVVADHIEWLPGQSSKAYRISAA